MLPLIKIFLFIFLLMMEINLMGYVEKFLLEKKGTVGAGVTAFYVDADPHGSRKFSNFCQNLQPWAGIGQKFQLLESRLHWSLIF